MTDRNIELTRRKALLGLGTIGVAGAGAGVGTSALFSDEESFEDNSITAGELDLIVDYNTSYDFNDPEGDGSGEINGNPADYSYELTDVKPGDSGTLVFCPKIVDNPGHLFVASADGITNYENGQTEPEEDVDASDGGNLTGGNDGDPKGDLGQEILADVKYVKNVTDATTYDEIRTVTTDQTLNGLLADLESGFRVDGVPNDPDTVYPSSSDASTQNGPCIAIEWELPVTVGNKIQSDAVEFTFSFAAVQSRNNPAPTNPVATVSVGSGSGYDYSDLSTALSNESDEVIGLAGGETFTLSGGANANASLVPLGFQSMPTVEVDGGQLRLTSNDLTIAGLDIDLLNGGVVYNPNPADGLAFINNDVSISESSNHGIRIEGVGALNAVISNNRFEQLGQPVANLSNFPQGVLLSDGQNVVISDNEFTAQNPGGSNNAIEGFAVYVPQSNSNLVTSNLVISDNTISRWESGVVVSEQENDKIYDISITGNVVSDSTSANTYSLNTADIWLLDDTGSEGFENVNGEDTESTQETALESDNTLTSDGADVVL